jgi:hypothetical protein
MFQPSHDLNDVLSALALTKDNFGEALAQGAMMIQARIAEIFVRQIAQLLDGIFDAAIACPDVVQ